jgi:hypothetical protein
MVMGLGRILMSKWFALAIAAALLSGCASVTRGTTENISISSTPSGVEATITGMDVPTSCLTPCAIVVKRSADITVAFNKEGFEPQIVPLTTEVAGSGAAGFAGNILLGGGVGMIVDGVTSAAMDHKPNPVIVNMRPAYVPPPPVALRVARKPRPLPPKTTAPQAGT